jgi:hypothetical protein
MPGPHSSLVAPENEPSAGSAGHCRGGPCSPLRNWGLLPGTLLPGTATVEIQDRYMTRPEPPYFAAKRRVRRIAAVPGSLSLTALARIYDSDKRTGHGYLPLYARHFSRRRFSVRRLLEIGVGGYEDPYTGLASLRMWRSFFPRAQLFGLDINTKVVDEPRITFVKGSQDDSAVLDHLVEIAGGSFDIVIDDGSHINAHVRTTFEHLFPYVTPGGLYVIEDLQTAYAPDSGGGPPGWPGTSIAMVKDLVDGLNRAHIEDGFDFRPTQLLASEMQLYPNIAFIGRQ